MKKLKFIPILGSLEKLTEIQRQEYIERLCDHLGIPSDLGLVELAYQDSGDGARSLNAYVRKGGAEIIRANRGIDTDEITPCHGDGFVAFTCKAHDKTGRHEIAVGAVSIKGVSGGKLADCLMWAETRASRRVTLKFAGGGVHDESEMSEKTSNIVYALQPLQEIAQPTVSVNSGAGKDVTPVTVASEAKPLNSAIGTMDSVVALPEEPKKRHKKRTEIVLDLPESPKADIQESQRTVTSIETHVAIPTETVVATEPIRVGTTTISKITKEQELEFRKRLSVYTNDVLPKAGFLQSEKFGSRNAKLGMFVKKKFPVFVNVANVTVDNWEELFKYMESSIQTVGAEKFVQIIDNEIGETK